MWDVEFTEEFELWWDGLSVEQQEAIDERISLLEREGPALRRPYIGEISGSAFDPQMKEMRIAEGGTLRILLMFDPRRAAILLLGGDKTGQWNRWYRTAIPAADDLYRTHLDELRKEGLI